MSLYRNILKRAWEITWKFKYLWFFGLFAALLGNGGEYEIIARSFDINNPESGFFQGIKNFSSTGIFSTGIFTNISQLAANDLFNFLMVVILFVIVAVLSAFMVWLVMVSQAALVNNSASITADKPHDFKGGVLAGAGKFWPVFGLNLISRAVTYLIFVVIGLPVVISFSRTSALVASIVFVVSFLIFIPAAIIASFIVKYAIAYVVIKGEKFWEALKNGWRLFVNNWLISLEMAFILFFINFFAGICLVLLLLILAIPFLFLALLFIKAGMFLNFWTIITLAMMVFLAAIVLVGSGLATFQISSWTGLFIELVGRGGVSKLIRVFDKKES